MRSSVTDHIHTARPGERECFVCNVDTLDAARAELGLAPMHEHEPVEREYGPDQSVIECRRCGIEWPCPAIKAINRNAKIARERRALERQKR